MTKAQEQTAKIIEFSPGRKHAKGPNKTTGAVTSGFSQGAKTTFISNENCDEKITTGAWSAAESRCKRRQGFSTTRARSSVSRWNIHAPPGRLGAVCALEHDLLGFCVTIPPLDGLDIHRAELPFLELRDRISPMRALPIGPQELL